MATKQKKFAVTFGSDPELFLFDRQSRKIVSSIPVIKFDKHDPVKLGGGIKMYADNVLVEAAMPPSDSKDGMLEQFHRVFKAMQRALGNNFSLVPQAAYKFPMEELNDPKAWESGCDPNFNVYDGCANPPAQFNDGLRSGSFHVHIGNKNFKKEKDGHLLNFHSRELAIKLMDLFVGVPSLVFDKDETAPIRRALYGKAGEFRPTPYGIEYRVLGNFALRSPKITELVFDLINHGLNHLISGSGEEVLKTVGENNVRQAIDTNNVTLAQQLMAKSELPSKLLAKVKKNYNTEFYKAWRL